MASEYELKMQAAELRNLKTEIQQELTQVETLLNSVNAACEELPMDDPIMAAIEEAGGELHEKWGQLCETFHSVGETLDGVISNVEAAIERIVDQFKGMNKGL